jgi:type II secretory pathway pseudopilin PulG
MALLFMLMLLSISAVAAAESWSMKRQREREAELIWVGDQYRQAVESYWRATPGPRKALPARVEQLLNDDRFALPVHHLRRAYGDPLEDGRELEPLLRNNTLVGVHSTLQGTPVKQGGFPARYAGFAGAGSYDAWNFVFQPPALASLAPPPARR